MIIAVTQEHIDSAHDHDPNRCPIALAVRAAGFADCRVGRTTMRYLVSGEWVRLALTLRQRQFVARFDAAGNIPDKLARVHPFEFEIPHGG